jgi:hypothetical protein
MKKKQLASQEPSGSDSAGLADRNDTGICNLEIEYCHLKVLKMATSMQFIGLSKKTAEIKRAINLKLNLSFQPKIKDYRDTSVKLKIQVC